MLWMRAESLTSLISSMLELPERHTHDQQLEMEHIQVATVLSDLVDLYRCQKLYVQAESFAEQALSISIVLLGQLHSSTATAMNNLAYLYEKQEKYTEAEPLYRRTLLISEQTQGADHPQTAIATDNRLPILWGDFGEHPRSQPIQQERQTQVAAVAKPRALTHNGLRAMLLTFDNAMAQASGEKRKERQNFLSPMAKG